jgi:hypothetical protein
MIRCEFGWIIPSSGRNTDTWGDGGLTLYMLEELPIRCGLRVDPWPMDLARAIPRRDSFEIRGETFNFQR